MPDREQQVLALIRKEPMLPQQSIADRLGISRSAVAGYVMSLTNKGLIKGRGYVLSDTPFVAVIGGTNIDIHGKPTNPLRPNDSNPGVVTISAGGVARNVAENLARLGIDARLVSAIGDDHHGHMLAQLCRDAGIDTQHLHQVPAATTSSYLSVLDSRGDMQVAVSDMSVMDTLNEERLRPLQAMLQQAQLLLIDTNLTPGALAWISETFAGKAIFADTVSTTKALRIKPHLQSIHTLKMSGNEAAALTGLPTRTQTQLRAAARQLHADGVQRLFVTLGPKGVFYSSGGTSGMMRRKSTRHKVQNAGGAGDAFLAGLVYAWLQNWPMDETLRFAQAAAQITVADTATSSPTLSLTTINKVLRDDG